MSYKFVTREDDDFRFELASLHDLQIAERLINRLIAERDAYRSMLKGRYQKQKEVTKEEYEKISGMPVTHERVVSYNVFETDWEAIDAEAARILEKK